MIVGIGQDSHRFDFANKSKKLVLGGVMFEDHPPLKGNSDADVVLHSITNAISGITCVNILGEKADEMCLNNNIIDSREYVKESLKHLKKFRILHVSVSIECQTPKLSSYIPKIRSSLSSLLNIPENSVGITATSGENLTEFGRGKGIQVMSCVTASEL